MMAAKLSIRRMCVLTREGLVAYDETFHPGVNIIRGDNSSGKSTITHLLFFGLGGEYADFVPQARKCRYVFLEIVIDGVVISLKREIKLANDGRVSARVPITIYFCELNDAMENKCESKTFNYNSSENQKSFSNVLFDLLKLPQVIGDCNITMHQLLRLLYIDQESPTNSLFMFEQFDSQLTRETTADLLMGIYDSNLYKAKIRQREVENSLQELKFEIKSVKNALSGYRECSSAFLLSEIEAKKQEIISIDKSILDKKNNCATQELPITLIETTKNEISELRKKVVDLENRVRENAAEDEDTKLFIEALNRKIDALKKSVSVRTCLSDMELDFCPECLTKLENNVDKGHCRLCKAPIDNSKGLAQAKRYELEISFQIQESKAILEENEQKVIKNKAELIVLRAQLKAKEESLSDLLKNVQRKEDEEIDGLIYKKGLCEGEKMQLLTMLEKAEYYESLLQKQTEMQCEMDRLERFIKAKRYEQASNRKLVSDKIRDFGIYFLQHDLNRQHEFMSADDFFVDFSNNIVYLSNKYAKYSASSNFYLKVVARFALFFASLELPIIRFPHFIFADNMEDKGIEIERAQNLQKQIITKLQEYNVKDYQVIYTTSYITQELEDSPFVVGERYSQNNKSLRNV